MTHPLSEDQLHIGVASVDITPPLGAVMVGYRSRRATSIAHPLRAEAMVCRGPGGAWALITSDTIGYTRAFADPVRAAIAEALGIPAGAVVLSGTHTHSGPCSIVFGRGEKLDPLDRDYLDELSGKLVALAQRAADDAQPGSFEVAYTRAPDVAHNRRIQREDGTWANEWEDREGKHPGYYDPAIMLVAVRRPDGRRDALLVNFGCHPVVLGPQSLALSGDYVGYLRRQLDAEANAGLTLFALAACGDINPRTCIQTDEAHPGALGEKVARLVLDALPGLEPVAASAVASCCVEWSITRTREAGKYKGAPGRNAGDVFETPIVALRAGELGIIAAPGELFSEYNAMLRAASPTRHTLVVTLANDYPGYLPTDEAQRQGAYETTMAPADHLEQPLMQHAAAAFAGVEVPDGDRESV
ncbi:MAG: neutral/alkaline non-lysosomal ceramidase N-terminal domain-containing protein [Phycisphaeraceae bacterium]